MKNELVDIENFRKGLEQLPPDIKYHIEEHQVVMTIDCKEWRYNGLAIVGLILLILLTSLAKFLFFGAAEEALNWSGYSVIIILAISFVARQLLDQFISIQWTLSKEGGQWQYYLKERPIGSLRHLPWENLNTAVDLKVIENIGPTLDPMLPFKQWLTGKQLSYLYWLLTIIYLAHQEGAITLVEDSSKHLLEE